GLKEIEVFAMLPFADLQVEARDLGLLDLAVVVDEGFTDSFAQHLVLAQRFERLRKRARQELGLGLVRRVGGRRQTGAAFSYLCHAVEAGVNLRGEIQIGIRRRLADAVLDPRRGIPGTADDAQQRTAVFLAPDDAI